MGCSQGLAACLVTYIISGSHYMLIFMDHWLVLIVVNHWLLSRSLWIYFKVNLCGFWLVGYILRCPFILVGTNQLFVSNQRDDFFQALYSNCLNWKSTAKITYHLHIYPQFIYESFHLHYIISFLSRENINSQLTSLPMCGFIAQLIEHRTGIAEVTGLNPVEALIFFRLLYPIA